jgi:hypothetical protein
MLPALILFAVVWIAVPTMMHATHSSVGTLALILLLPLSCFAAGAVFGLRLGARWIGGTALRIAAGVVFSLPIVGAWQRWETLQEQRRAAARGELPFRFCAGDCADPSVFVEAGVISGFAAVAVVLALFSGAVARLSARMWRKGRA